MTWDALTRELEAWAANRRRATLWWRDDGVLSWSPALYRLLQVTEAGPVSLALAVMPALVDGRLSGRLSRARRVSILQHGVAGRNHALPDAPPSEFPDHREPAVMAAEVCQGWLQIAELFGAQARPWFVPPWNRAAPVFLAGLARLGFQGLSAFGPRPIDPCSWTEGTGTETAPVMVNTHLDPMKPGGGAHPPVFRGEDDALAILVAHLAARRTGRVDAEEPTGILTHHRELTPDAWVFLERLVAVTTAHPGARWLAPDVAFAPPSAVARYLRALPTVS